MVWEIKDVNQPNDADRLPNGNTLVATANRVVEFGLDGVELNSVKRGKRVSEVVRR